jgi:predicted RNase H-like nuclease
VGFDDLLDALALAMTAVADAEEWRTLPAEPQRDAAGRPMRIAYRPTEPLF